MKTRLLIAVALSSFALSCDSKPRAETTPVVESPVATPAKQPAPIAAPAAPEPAPECDAWEAWESIDSDASEARMRAAFVQTVKGWTHECRQSALRDECAKICDDDLLADMLIQAEAPGERRKALIQTRHGINSEHLAKATQLQTELAELVAHAERIRSAPRLSFALCMRRMTADIAKIEALEARLNSGPIVAQGHMVALLSLARTCLNCGEERGTCGLMRERLKSIETSISKFKKLVARDAKQVAAR